jgi:SulP family sulfate permease
MKTLFKVTNLKSNIQSAFTVALISIPLLISLAVASGVSPIVGIMTGILAGMIAAFFGGSNFSIVGPTGALSGLIASYALQNGSHAVPALAVITGLFILIAYVFHLERYLIFVPSSVIHGFTLGVACVLVLGQINFALGLKGMSQHDKFIDNVIESCRHANEFSCHALVIFLCFFGALILWKKYVPSIPGPIIVSPVGIGIGYAVQQNMLPLNVTTLGDKFGPIVFEFVQIPHFVFTQQLLISGGVIAFVSIIESMLSAKIADVMTKTKHKTHKEVLGLGMANLISGLAGGMPVTASLARTALNIKAGATSWLSALLCSVFIALVSFFSLSYFAYIPMVVVAAILVYVAVNMVDLHHFSRFFHKDMRSFVISMLVAVVTIFEDPIIGILVGSVAALLLLVNTLTHSYYHVATHEIRATHRGDLAEARKENMLVYTFKGKLVYLNCQAHLMRFQSDFTSYAGIILVLDDLYYLDLDGIDVLDEIIELLGNRGQRVMLVRPNAQIVNMLHASAQFAAREQAGLVFNSVADALHNGHNAH